MQLALSLRVPPPPVIEKCRRGLLGLSSGICQFALALGPFLNGCYVGECDTLRA